MSKAKGKSSIPDDVLSLYDKLVKTNPRIERKEATMPYTSINGHMFSFLDKHGAMGLRLPEQERNDFLKRYKTKLFVAHGVVLKEYVAVPGKLLKETKRLQRYFKISFAYTKSLKPK